jgi:hypothetical protein
MYLGTVNLEETCNLSQLQTKISWDTLYVEGIYGCCRQNILIFYVLTLFAFDQ